ncbi:phosphonopyruvate decarboxylase [Thalassococcus sp. S3]|nr:phosphonopyruvate decarboxylase [Thalassococcus sp. S3]
MVGAKTVHVMTRDMSVMLDPENVVDSLNRAGFSHFVGVPCSLLQPLIAAVRTSARCSYIPASSEGEAVAIAAGLRLSGTKPVVFMQNSGIGNAVNPLTSLTCPLEIPVLFVVGMRGGATDNDSLEHLTMGRISEQMLSLMGIRSTLLTDDLNALERDMRTASRDMQELSKSHALLVTRGLLSSAAEPSTAGPRDLEALYGDGHNAAQYQRADFIETITQFFEGEAALLATTGGCWKELRQHRQSAADFYQMGSMGCVSAIGLGIALQTEKTVVVLDGDGAALMKLGNMSTIGALQPGNLVHVVFDNAQYESTGGQPTAAATVRFASVALACGYPSAVTVTTPPALKDALSDAIRARQTTFIHIPVLPGHKRDVGHDKVDFVSHTRAFERFIQTPSEVLS